MWVKNACRHTDRRQTAGKTTSIHMVLNLQDNRWESERGEQGLLLWKKTLTRVNPVITHILETYNIIKWLKKNKKKHIWQNFINCFFHVLLKKCVQNQKLRILFPLLLGSGIIGLKSPSGHIKHILLWNSSHQSYLLTHLVHRHNISRMSIRCVDFPCRLPYCIFWLFTSFLYL